MPYSHEKYLEIKARNKQKDLEMLNEFYGEILKARERKQLGLDENSQLLPTKSEFCKDLDEKNNPARDLSIGPTGNKY